MLIISGIPLVCPTRLIHGMMQFGWNRCLQGRHTIVSSFVKSLSQTAHSGEDSTNKPTEYMLRYEPSSRAVGWR